VQSQGKRRVIAASIIGILVLATLISIGIYFVAKNNSKEELEDAQFTIDSFDIIDATSKYVVIEFRLNVSNIPYGGNSIFVDEDHIKITLLNNSLPIADFDVSLGSGEFTESQLIQTEIPFDGESNNPLLSGLIDNILSGDNFFLEFEGHVNYNVGRIISDSFTFKNQIQFIVNSTALSLSINEIGITNLDVRNANLNVEIVNPFSTDILVKGIIYTRIGGFNLGNISLNNGLLVESGVHNYTTEWNLDILPQNALTEILKRYNSSIDLLTDLQVSINDFQIDASPDLKLSFGENLIDFNIVEVTNFETNTNTGSLQVEFNMELFSNIPLQLNITSILMDFTTISDTEIGKLNWTNQDSISVPPYSSTIISNVAVVFSEISASVILEIAITQAIKVPKVVLTLQFFDQELEILFQLERIDL
jgi:hypothetical protein